MSSDDTIPMHKEFPVWVSELDFEDNPDKREEWWNGVAAFVGDTGIDEIENLVLLAFNTRKKATPSFLETFCQFFHHTSPGLMQAGNLREMEVLAGCILVALLEGDDTEIGTWVALCIITASAGERRKHKQPMNIVGFAERTLIKMAEKNSQRPKLNDYISTVEPEFNLDAVVAKVEAQFDAVSVAEAFELAAVEISSTLSSMNRNQNMAIKAANTFMQQQDEELQMLWWLTGGCSIDEGCTFNKVAKNNKPLLFAKELADQTEVLPGPCSINGLLFRAGLKDTGKLAFIDTINDAKDEWLAMLVEGIAPSPVTQPIHFAIQRRLETGAGETWVSGWAAATELDADLSFSSLELGKMFYRERLLVLFS